MFFRIKKIAGNEYAYIVENKWKKKSSRQKVRDYIGKVYRFNLVNDADFQQFAKFSSIEEYMKNNENNGIINDLIGWEFFKFGINKKEFSVDLNKSAVIRSKKNVALHINEGFMCDHTLRNLTEFKITGDEESDGFRLARAFVETGIKVPKEIFVGFFNKLYKTQEKTN